MVKLTALVNRIKAFAAAGVAVAGIYASDAAAQDRHDNDARIEHRLENPLPESTETTFISITPQAAVYLNVDGVELNHELFGYAVGEKLSAHIGLGSLLLDEDSTELSLGLGLSTSFMPIITGGVYDGFVAQQNIDFSAMFLDDSVSGGLYAGTGAAFVNTLDPWRNERIRAYGNLHAGARLVLWGYAALELELGGVFNEDDAGFYAALGIGVALPKVD